VYSLKRANAGNSEAAEENLSVMRGTTAFKVILAKANQGRCEEARISNKGS
jgi:hypothetical protein